MVELHPTLLKKGIDRGQGEDGDRGGELRTVSAKKTRAELQIDPDVMVAFSKDFGDIGAILLCSMVRESLFMLAGSLNRPSSILLDAP